ncbi:hypothetical protein ATCC90586_011699 [Pythium insidiosum]|nr:hypothetical protein ATCC90586_011699 [Pythium insidiosum]
MLDNALYGILRIPEADGGDRAVEGGDQDVFTCGEADPGGQVAIGRRSYIDDILIGDSTFDGMCQKLERLMQACERWSLSISLPKSQFAMRQVDYLGQRISGEGVEAKPKNGDELSALVFPKTVKGIQSFLGSLNYYHRFIPDFAVHAAALYEVTQQDLDRAEANPSRLRAAHQGFETLKSRLTHAPVLRHFDESKPIVVVIFANDWAIAAAVMQGDPGELRPTRYVGRVLKDNKRKFSPAEREVLALLRVLDVCYTLLAGKPIRVLTRSTTMGWLLRAKGLQGRLGVWSALLSPWSLQVEVALKGEHQTVGLVAAALSPEANIDEALDAVRR